MEKRLFFVAVIFLSLSLNAIGQNAKKYYKAGTEFVESLRFEDAVVQFTSAIGLDPSNPEYYNERGRIYEILKKYPEARADYEKALVFEPKQVDYIVSIGSICNKTGNYEEALVYLNHASDLDKRFVRTYTQKVITLIGLERYDQALKVSDTAIIIKDTPMDYYYRGVIYRKMNNDVLAKKEFEKSISKDKELAEPRLALAELLIKTNPKEALNQCNVVLSKNDHNTDAYLVRSRIHMNNLDYPSAINDLSKNILIDPTFSAFYLYRGNCYQQFNQHTNAINDYSKYISLEPNDPDAYFARAKSYEEILNFDKAMEDYAKITVLSEFDMKARKMLKEAQIRLYELNRETVVPEITVMNPTPADNIIEIRGDKTEIMISGKIKDKSKIKTFLINEESIPIAEKNGAYEFFTNINVSGFDKISIVAIDDYNNHKKLDYALTRTEINPPSIALVAPYTSDEKQVFIDTPTPNIAIQGKITDDSRIKSITIGDITASYRRDEFNPSFTAILDISNINKFTVTVEDIYGNITATEFTLNREGAEIAAGNPMGRTWAIFIENSGYETFASLDGPIKDVSTMQRALANYQFHNVIHKKDMTKAEMEKFFNIELRDLVKKNQVKSLLVWYAGHGKFINDIGYWIPVDAKRDDEFTYFNINALKAGLQGYAEAVVHTLVISDACESGPSFYTASRSANDAPTCDNTLIAGAKSAQVFSSAGYELAIDNSKFTATFANTLENNRNACIPIDIIVQSVTSAVETEAGQKPKFGKIQGLEDMNGTFFFIAK